MPMWIRDIIDWFLATPEERKQWKEDADKYQRYMEEHKPTMSGEKFGPWSGF